MKRELWDEKVQCSVGCLSWLSWLCSTSKGDFKGFCNVGYAWRAVPLQNLYHDSIPYVAVVLFCGEDGLRGEGGQNALPPLVRSYTGVRLSPELRKQPPPPLSEDPAEISFSQDPPEQHVTKHFRSLCAREAV